MRWFGLLLIGLLFLGGYATISSSKEADNSDELILQQMREFEKEEKARMAQEGAGKEASFGHGELNAEDSKSRIDTGTVKTEERDGRLYVTGVIKNPTNYTYDNVQFHIFLYTPQGDVIETQDMTFGCCAERLKDTPFSFQLEKPLKYAKKKRSGLWVNVDVDRAFLIWENTDYKPQPAVPEQSPTVPAKMPEPILLPTKVRRPAAEWMSRCVLKIKKLKDICSQRKDACLLISEILLDGYACAAGWNLSQWYVQHIREPERLRGEQLKTQLEETQRALQAAHSQALERIDESRLEFEATRIRREQAQLEASQMFQAAQIQAQQEQQRKNMLLLLLGAVAAAQAQPQQFVTPTPLPPQFYKMPGPGGTNWADWYNAGRTGGNPYVLAQQHAPVTRQPLINQGGGSSFGGEYRLCPDGSYVAGTGCYLTPTGKYVGGSNYRLCPDGSYVVGGNCTLTPAGTYVGGKNSILCPDGSYVSGNRCVLTPNGKYIGAYD